MPQNGNKPQKFQIFSYNFGGIEFTVKNNAEVGALVLQALYQASLDGIRLPDAPSVRVTDPMDPSKRPEACYYGPAIGAVPVIKALAAAAKKQHEDQAIIRILDDHMVIMIGDQIFSPSSRKWIPLAESALGLSTQVVNEEQTEESETEPGDPEIEVSTS
jgi:hypothetical protein